MGATKVIRQLMIERGMTVRQLAKALGIAPQSMSNKLYRDSFGFAEVEKIANILNCDIALITRDSGKTFR